MLPFISWEVLLRGVGMLMPPLHGALKYSVSKVLHISVSSLGGAEMEGVLHLVFLSEMTIYFPCISGDIVGHGLRNGRVSQELENIQQGGQSLRGDTGPSVVWVRFFCDAGLDALSGT